MRRGSTLVEFAITWPICLLLVFGCVQLSIWGAESYSARQAALAAARLGQVPGTTQDSLAAVALSALGRSLVGTTPRAWCPGDPRPSPDVWVCVGLDAGSVEVRVGGNAPAILPLLPGRSGLPLGADVKLARETFAGP